MDETDRDPVMELGVMAARWPRIAATLAKYGYSREEMPGQLREVYWRLMAAGLSTTRSGTFVPAPAMYDSELLELVLSASATGKAGGALGALAYRHCEAHPHH